MVSPLAWISALPFVTSGGRGNPYEHRHSRFSYDVWDLRSAGQRSKADSEGLMLTWALRRFLQGIGRLRPLPGCRARSIRPAE